MMISIAFSLFKLKLQICDIYSFNMTSISLIANWSRYGFLLSGRFLYPLIFFEIPDV